MHPEFKAIKSQNSVLHMSSFYFMKHSRTDSLNFSVSTVCVAEMQPAGSCTSIQGHPYLQHILQGMQALNYHSA